MHDEDLCLISCSFMLLSQIIHFFNHAFCFPTDHPHILKKKPRWRQQLHSRQIGCCHISLRRQFGASELSDITGFLELPDGKASCWSPSWPSSVLGWVVTSDGPRHFQFPRFPPCHVGWCPLQLPACQVVTGSECATLSDWTPHWWWWDVVRR